MTVLSDISVARTLCLDEGQSCLLQRFFIIIVIIIIIIVIIKNIFT
jgi:hypothetical protein